MLLVDQYLVAFQEIHNVAIDDMLQDLSRYKLAALLLPPFPNNGVMLSLSQSSGIRPFPCGVLGQV